MGYNRGRTNMQKFLLRASICESGLYQRFATDEIRPVEIVSAAFERGVTDFDEVPYEGILNGFVGLVGSWIVTYDRNEDMFDIWTMLNL